MLKNHRPNSCCFFKRLLSLTPAACIEVPDLYFLRITVERMGLLSLYVWLKAVIEKNWLSKSLGCFEVWVFVLEVTMKIVTTLKAHACSTEIRTSGCISFLSNECDSTNAFRVSWRALRDAHIHLLIEYKAPIDTDTSGSEQQSQFQIILTTFFNGVFSAN